MDNIATKTKLIIIPGWGGSKETWSDFISLALSDFEVEVIELPCFGIEPCPTSIWGVEEYSQFVTNKLNALKKPSQQTILLGHSFGGQIATYLLGNNPNIVDKLILSGAAVYRKPKSAKNYTFKFMAKSGKIVFSLPILNKLAKIMRKVLYKIIGTGDYNKTTGIKRDIFLKITKQDVSQYLSKIKIPTLVVWGDKDVFVSIKNAKEIAKNLPNSQLKIIKNGTHGLHLWKKEELLKIIMEFLK
ncbi:MAG: alpha/beta hydrolase [Candidatus Magasanikbacteria bacterium]